MLNYKSIHSVNNAQFNEYFKKPDSEYNLARIPATILSLFGISQGEALPLTVFGNCPHTYKKVVLFLLDGFGYNMFTKFYLHSAFLSAAKDDGVVSKLTTQFPSTTTANITTLHTGLPVGKTGVNEWFYYEKKIDGVYSPFLYRKALDDEGIKLTIAPEEILPNENMYTNLKNHGVSSYVFQYEPLNEGPYSTYIHRGANVVGFKNLDDGLKQLKEVLKKDETMYCYLYHADIDKVSHEFGPESAPCEAEILKTLNSLDAFFETFAMDDTLILLTADHGQTTAVIENAVYLNRDLPELLPMLKTTKDGEIIAPCGSFRDMFLHVREEYLSEAFQLLTKKLADIAEVYYVKDLIQEGVFGETVSPEFLDRIGDVVILAYKDQAVWWYVENKIYVKHLGMHGGLSSEELEIPLVLLPL